ncbi:MAG: cupin domain-containing protein [Gammaproteobacteria bacterium]|jgi:quercetin dioxygenase-like cupin family protein|nr:cupin 2, conserved barrel domain protein [uncultured bacterium]MCC6632253.1 cupin domain-containing protein [Gammaproteobacteria bacterium]
MTSIRTLSTEEVQARVARYSSLQPMSIAKDLEWVPQEAMDVVYARTILPMILEDQKNPFGKTAPVFGAGGLTMYISVIPPGQGPCLHSHNNTYETFMVLEGEIEYEIGDPVAHRVRLGKYDAFSCPPAVYRGFRNVGEGVAVQLTVITGESEGARDDVSMPASIAASIERDFGPKVTAAFRDVFTFAPAQEAVGS